MKGPSTPTLAARARRIDCMEEIDDSEEVRGRWSDSLRVGRHVMGGVGGELEGERMEEDDDERVEDEAEDEREMVDAAGRTTAAPAVPSTAAVDSCNPIELGAALTVAVAPRTILFLTTASRSGFATSVVGSGSLNLILAEEPQRPDVRRPLGDLKIWTTGRSEVKKRHVRASISQGTEEEHVVTPSEDVNECEYRNWQQNEDGEETEEGWEKGNVVRQRRE
ncbi:hypothetical protein P7C70_g7584, partial [Phenoliferia sp. Uapishka_3]